MQMIHSPQNYDKRDHLIFLAGSIEMGKAEDWQQSLPSSFEDFDVTFLNPRRLDWDSSWIQDPTLGTKFHEQVTWELDGIENSNTIFFHFVAGTQSPITLLELGHALNLFGKNIIVSCPKDFWRYGNVQIMCDRVKVNVFTSLEEAKIELRNYLEFCQLQTNVPS